MMKRAFRFLCAVLLMAGVSSALASVQAIQRLGTAPFTLSGTASSTLSLSAAATSPQASLIAGWNLLGNSVNAPITVASAFPIAPTTTNVSTVWKWIAASSRWAFYSPMQDDGGQAYATGKGYDFLTTINGGEGFWVNAKTPFTLQLPPGNAIASTVFADQPTGISNLPAGWSLIATGDNPTPKAFANTLALNPPALGAATSLTTLWAWDSTLSNWYFYAPGLDNAGTLTNYITNKNYLDFSGTATSAAKTLDSTSGFWVNHPSAASVTAMMSTDETDTCALSTSSNMFCWGATGHGETGSLLADITGGYQNIPIAVTSGSGTGTLSGVRQIANGVNHTCALMQTGIVKCWGENTLGQTGNGLTETSVSYFYPSSTVVDLLGTGTLNQVRSIAASDNTSCAVMASGALNCWGWDLRNGIPSGIPSEIIGSGVTAVSVGISNGCALSTGGAVGCWGNYDLAGTGGPANGPYTEISTPMQVVGTGSGVTIITAVAVGGYHTCALTQAGGVVC